MNTFLMVAWRLSWILFAILLVMSLFNESSENNTFEFLAMMLISEALSDVYSIMRKLNKLSKEN